MNGHPEALQLVNSTRFAFTVFIPTYNRAHLLPKALQSVADQTFRYFEVIIVDDGSVDDTRRLVSEWCASVPFPVTYHYQSNRGKIAAHNAAVTMARGELFVSLDSDDTLLPDALERLHHHWQSISIERRGRFSGVEGHTATVDGKICGALYPQDRMESNFLEMHYRLGVWGDKKGALRTDLLRQYPYPLFPGEKHVRDSLLWEDLAERYLCLFVNEVFQEVEQHADGMTANIFKVRMLNPRGFRYYYLREVCRPAHYFTRGHRLDSYHRFIRFSLHSGVGLRQQWREAPDKLDWLRMLPKGCAKWLSDIMRMRRHGIQRSDKRAETTSI